MVEKESVKKKKKSIKKIQRVRKGSEKIKKRKRKNGRKGKEIIKVKGRRRLAFVLGLYCEFATECSVIFREKIESEWERKGTN